MRSLRALIPALLLTAACGTTGTSGSSPTAGSTAPSTLAYAQCMRAHGITDFPDPGSDGELSLNAAPGTDLDPGNPTYQAADAACTALLPPKQAPPSGLAAANLKYAQCMRAHGVSDFPDPKPDGSLQVQAAPGTDLDPRNPAYKAADGACKQYQPNGGAGGGLSTGGGA